MRPETLEFMLNGMEVGYFEGGQIPERDGEYEYEPYRGPGHYDLATALQAGQMPECYYETESETVFFTVSAQHATITPVIKYTIQLANFRRVLK